MGMNLASMPEQPNGILAAYKPSNWTSFDVCAKLRGTLQRTITRSGSRQPGRRKRIKVGHGGTLDPMATGLLVVGIGSGCRKLQDYLTGSKGYIARCVFGVETDTQDATGRALREAPVDVVSEQSIRAALPEMTGTIQQCPPAFSALKHKGKRSYDLARKGELAEEDMEAREVIVHALSLEGFDPTGGVAFGQGNLPEATLHVECGSGVYVRSLIVDLARSLGSGAHMTALERTKQGPFCLHPRTVRVLSEPEFGDFEAITEAMQSAEALLSGVGHQLDANPPHGAPAQHSTD